MKKTGLLILALLFLLEVGCTKSIRYSEEEISGFPPNIQENIRKGEVTIGMTHSQVRYAWGAPDSVIVLLPSEDGKNQEEWIYGKLFRVFKTKLIFTDGSLTEIISNDPGVK
jgi:hypothetical protein